MGTGCPGCLRRCHRFCGALVGWLLRRKIFPALLARSWHFSATPILLRSLQGPLERMAFYSGLYLALTSLPWAIPGLTKFLLTAYKIASDPPVLPGTCTTLLR